MAATNGKDTIYIDVDDEITSVIDKVRSSDDKIVALVLPKRATTFQSSVNMKLLKRTADEAKKKVVLITGEPGLMPLAAAAGLYVASNLQSKPEIPSLPGEAVDAPQASVEETLSVSSGEGINAEKAADRPVGELAAAAGVASKLTPSPDDIETLDIEDDTLEEDKKDEVAPTAKPVKKSKNKKLRVPNFEKFRLGLVLGVLALILLIVGAVFAFKVLPKATINIKTDASTLASNLTLTLDTNANSVDPTRNVVPATTQQEKKTNSQQVPATGKKNEGDKATGSVTMSVQECSFPVQQPADVPAGTGVSTSNLTYITQQDTTFTSSPQPNSNGTCLVYQADSSTPVTAQLPGKQYNTSATNYTVAGRPEVNATSSNGMSGGTDNIVTVVSQTDINSAEKKLSSSDLASVRQDLAQQLEQNGLFPIESTLANTSPSYSADNQVGDAASNVTVSEVVTYTMYGVKKNDLKSLVDNDVKQQIDTSKQSILSEGLDSATFKVTNTTATSVTGNLSTIAVAGPDLKVSDIKKQVAGKKAGDIQSLLKSNPGVTGVTVHFSPFWVSSAPSNPSKITVVIAKPTAKQ